MTDTQQLPVPWANPISIPLTRKPFGGTVSQEPVNNAYFTNIQIAGVTHTVQVDTGSTGLVIPETLLLDENGVPKTGVYCLGPGEIIYYPSSDSTRGCYYLVEQVMLGELQGGGFAVQTGPLVVLGGRYSGLNGTDLIKPNMGMMGVGFGRPVLGRVNGTDIYQISNPFMAAFDPVLGLPLYPSYLMTNGSNPNVDYITLGVQPEIFSNNFSNAVFVPLVPGDTSPPNNVGDCSCVPTPRQQEIVGWLSNVNFPPPPTPPGPPPRPPAWTSPPATISISTYNGGEPTSGNLLLDTGLNLMMMSIISPVPDPAGSPPVWEEDLQGATISIIVPAPGGAPAMQYHFTLGQPFVDKATGANVYPPISGSTDMAPTFLQPLGLGNPPANFVNTGINPIQSYAYFYDGNLGNVGFAAYS